MLSLAKGEVAIKTQLLAMSERLDQVVNPLINHVYKITLSAILLISELSAMND